MLRVKDDMIVTVYNIPRQGFFPTLEGGFDMLVDMNTEVAYCESLQQLYICLDGVRYSKTQYIDDIIRTTSYEMLYGDYVQMCKDKLTAKYPDAPILATIELDASGNPKPVVPDHLKPHDGFKALRDAGLNFTIQR